MGRAVFGWRGCLTVPPRVFTRMSSTSTNFPRTSHDFRDTAPPWMGTGKGYQLPDYLNSGMSLVLAVEYFNPILTFPKASDL